MQDVEKTPFVRPVDEKRQRRRERGRVVYIIIVIFLVIFFFISLCMTVLFNIDTVEIGGESSDYTAAEIASASGVHTGDNLLRLNTSEVVDSILDRLIFIENVTVKKSFPTTLEITVTPCSPAYNLIDDSGALQVSASGKILKNSPEMDTTLPTIIGFEPADRGAGGQLTSKDSQKDQIFVTLTETMRGEMSYPITKIDMTDKYNIMITFDDRVEFEVGSWSDLDYKIEMGLAVLEQLDEDKTGYLTMIGDHQCAFREVESTYVPYVPREPEEEVEDENDETEAADEETENTQQAVE